MAGIFSDTNERDDDDEPLPLALAGIQKWPFIGQFQVCILQIEELEVDEAQTAHVALLVAVTKPIT